MSDQVYRPKPLIPRTPTEVRDEMVRHRTNFAKRQGVILPGRVVERQVLADLDIVEALKRGVDPTRHVSKGAPRPPPPEREVAGDLKLRTPGTPPKNFERLPVLHKNPLMMGVKWSKAVYRIGQIMHGMSPAPSLEESLRTATCPELALEWARLYVNYRMRHRLQRLNPFLGMSERDAARALVRGVMDICDRSTGRLGAWH